MSESPLQASPGTGTERIDEPGNDRPLPSAATAHAAAAAAASSVPQGVSGFAAADPEPDTEDPTTKGPPLPVENPDPEDDPPTDDA